MQEKGLSSFNLKLIAIVFMVIDHIHSMFGYELGLPRWISWLGRFVAPLFLYLLVEGFKYTHSRKKYATRLFIGAFVMLIINIIYNLVTKNYIHPITNTFYFSGLINGWNIFWTLFLFMMLFISLEHLRKQSTYQRLIWLVPTVGLLFLILFAEGGIYLLPIALACYFFNNNAKKVSFVIALWSLLLFLKSLISYYTGAQDVQTLYQYLTFSNEFMMFTAILFILSYNGERGGQGKSWEKNLFYILYPAHLAVIYILAWLFKL